MDKFKVGVIRVVTTSDTDALELHGRLIERYYPRIKTVSRCIPDQPTGVYSDHTQRLATPKVVALGRQLAREAEALVVSCCYDIGVEELRRVLDIPIIGAGEATAFLTAQYGTRFGVLGICDEPPPAYTRLLGGRIVGRHRPAGIHSPLHLRGPNGREAVYNAAQEIKQAGANAIAVACTGIGAMGVCGEIEARCAISVIDPIVAEGMMAYLECLRRRL